MINKKNIPLSGDTLKTSSDKDDYLETNSVIIPKISEKDLSQGNPEHHLDKKNASLRLIIPTYLDNQLTQIAASKRVTKRFLILNALAQAGYHIEKEELVTDKRKIR